MVSDVQMITTDQPDLWMHVLNEIGRYSLYHMPSFHRIAEMNGEGMAVMPVFRHGPHILAFPMLIRPVDVSSSREFDATSVRAFSGPLFSRTAPSDEVKCAFHADLQSFFTQNDIISAYSRLHPLTCDYSLLSGYGLVVETGVTLSMDLTLPPDVQWASYRRDHRKVTRRLQRKGFVCEEAGPECLDDIVGIYHQTMRRVGADQAFMFDKEHFEYLFNEMPDVIRLFVCKAGNAVAGFHICALCGEVIESYLSGTADEYVSSAPSRLLYDTLRLWGNKSGAKVIHLAGGVGAQRDCLYDFKAGFANNEHTYCTWRCIVNQDAYDSACRSVSRQSDQCIKTSYFPAYRDPGSDAQSSLAPHVAGAGNRKVN